jgi:hypothetical protein
LPRRANLQFTVSPNDVHNHDVTWEYGQTKGVTHCVRLKTVEKFTTPDGAGSGSSTWNDIRYDFSSVPKSRFYLSYYGLAEPPGAGSSWWIWAGLILGSGTVVVALLRIIKWRASAK